MAEQHRLANGATISHAPDTGPDWVGLGLWCRAGSRFEAPGQAGWAHLIEHLWFHGGRRHDAAAVDRLTDRLGGAVNGETSREFIGLWGLAPAGDADTLTELLLDCFLQPTFDDDAVATEQGLIAAEAADHANDAGATVSEGILAELWSGHPLARGVSGGAGDGPAAATAAALRAWYAARLTGDRVAATCLGHWSVAQCQRLERALTALPGGAGTPIRAPRVTPPLADRGLPSAPALVVWAAPMPGWCQPGYESARVLTNALGGGLSALLPGRLRREQGLVYDVRARLETVSDASAALIEVAAPDARQAGALVEPLLDRVAAEGLPAEALDTARRGLAARRALRATNPVDAMRLAAWQALCGDAGIDATPPPHARLAAGHRWRRHARITAAG